MLRTVSSRVKAVATTETGVQVQLLTSVCQYTIRALTSRLLLVADCSFSQLLAQVMPCVKETNSED